MQLPKPEAGGGGSKKGGGLGLSGVKRDRDASEAAGASSAATVAEPARRRPSSPLTSPPAQRQAIQEQGSHRPWVEPSCVEDPHMEAVHTAAAAAAVGPSTAFPACPHEARPRKWQQRPRLPQAEQPSASGRSSADALAAMAPDLELLDLTDTQPPPRFDSGEGIEASPAQRFGAQQDTLPLPAAAHQGSSVAGKSKRRGGGRLLPSSNPSGLQQSSLLSFFNRQ